MPANPLANTALASIGSDLELLIPHIKTVRLNQHMTLFKAGDEIEKVYFPHSGVVSTIVTFADGDMIQAGMTGSNGVVGISASLEGRRASHRALVQIAGRASVVSAEVLREIAKQSSAIHHRLLECQDIALAEAQQTVACVAKHKATERLASWLLRVSELTGSTRMEGLTQEFVAQLLGLRRTTVTMVAHKLLKARLIHYARGHVHIVRPAALSDLACECYHARKPQQQGQAA